MPCPLQFTYRASNRPSNLDELSIRRREIDWSSRINLRKPAHLTIWCHSTRRSFQRRKACAQFAELLGGGCTGCGQAAAGATGAVGLGFGLSFVLCGGG